MNWSEVESSTISVLHVLLTPTWFDRLQSSLLEFRSPTSQRTAMVRKRMGRWVVIFFLGLLGVQLTGLSCLNDFPLANSLRLSEDAHRAGAIAINEVSQFGEDSCPCHLTFASFMSAPVSAQGPVHPLAIVSPPIWKPLLDSFQFRPPKAL